MKLPPGKSPGPILCFTSGTRILTPGGERRIDALHAGDLVITEDAGPLPILWHGTTTVRASGEFAPIRFARDTMGNMRDLIVSPDHRVLINKSRHDEALASALSLVDNYRVTIDYGGMVTYHHILFDRPHIIFAEGMANESFRPCDAVIETLGDQARDALFQACPMLRTGGGQARRPVRPLLTKVS